MAERFPVYYQRDSGNDSKESIEKRERAGRLGNFWDKLEKWTNQQSNIHEITAQVPQFSISGELKKRKGPMVEVGGPTEEGFRLVPTEVMREVRDRFFISDREAGLFAWRQRHRRDTEGERYKEWPVDFAADASALPFRDSSLSAIFASCLPRVRIDERQITDVPLREPAIREAYRVLEPGGLLVWQGSFWNDLRVAQSLGFEMVAHTWGLLSEKQLNELINRAGADEKKLQDCEWVHANLVDYDRNDPKNRNTTTDQLADMTAPRYIIWRKPEKR